MSSVSEIVRGLTDKQREALLLLPAWGFLAGHNSWPATEYVTNDIDERSVCDGADMDAILRLGLAEVSEYQPGYGVLGEESDASWRLVETPLGLAVRQALARDPRSAE